MYTPLYINSIICTFYCLYIPLYLSSTICTLHPMFVLSYMFLLCIYLFYMYVPSCPSVCMSLLYIGTIMCMYHRICLFASISSCVYFSMYISPPYIYCSVYIYYCIYTPPYVHSLVFTLHRMWIPSCIYSSVYIFHHIYIPPFIYSTVYIHCLYTLLCVCCLVCTFHQV